MAEPIHVLISAANRPEAYDLLFLISRGEMFGPDQPVTISLYDSPSQEFLLESLIREVLDSDLQPLEDIHIVTNPDSAFRDVDVAIMLDTIDTNRYANKNEMVNQCLQVYSHHAKYLDKHGKQTIKVIVAGDPVNANTYILSQHTPSLPKSSFTGLLRMHQNRATFQVANKLNIPVEKVKNVLVWGSGGAGAFIDITHCTIEMDDGTSKNAIELLNNEHWMKHILQPYVQSKSSERSPPQSIAIMKAKAIVDHVKDLWFGTGERLTSMIVHSSGEYGAPDDFFSGYPVTIPNPKGNPVIAQNLTFEDWGESQFEKTALEMVELKKQILGMNKCEDEYKSINDS